MAGTVDYPVSVRLPGYVIKKIDELVKKKEFRSRSDFIKFAVTLALGQMMMEEAKELAKELTLRDIRAETEAARRMLAAGDFEDEWPEVKDVLEEVDGEYRRLTGARR
ncbi:ribbon-helix-helix protein, CopG family [Thermococcus sp. M36]|uniref:ribbon-helix-helix domain-containing protein n=1 Tax=Thermococcus sp. M36 TaxID=1638261 RepID=UPI00143C8FE2|nr:type II toxin-antitoxin system ParD family antitoxin [Thermococcus sp. M36]NJE05730.1 ribbon-helix-helix protein, CopG family [Thermococcus sp. M36]